MPAYSETAGSIILEHAYALGKMLDHSGWRNVLHWRRTPSDIDLCFDNNGKIIFCDLSNTCTTWDEISVALRGQRWLYESAIKEGPHCAVLLKHSVTVEMNRQIDTLRDIEHFQVMIWDFECVLSPVYSAAMLLNGVPLWQHFVQTWMNDPLGPLRMRRAVLGGSVGLTRPTEPISTKNPMENVNANQANPI